MRRILRALLCVLPLVAAACGDASGPNDPDLAKVTFAPALGVDISTMTRMGDGVYVKDLVVGEGAVLAEGHVVSTRYSGWLANGTEFQNNLSASEPYPFVFGQRRVIAGWEQGMVGMKVGGTRLLVIPPSLGYGNQAVGPIPANSVLVFQVKVVAQSS